MPGPEKHPNATGNLLSALTARGDVNVEGYIYWVGVGDMSRLGKPGEKRYKPKPIKRFLDWYRKQAAEEYAQREKARADAAAIRAKRAAERERARKLRERQPTRREWRRMWKKEAIRREEVVILGLEREFEKLQNAADRLGTTIANYDNYFSDHRRWQDERGRWHGYDFDSRTKKSYQAKREKHKAARLRLAELDRKMQELWAKIARHREGLITFRREYKP